jgi:hypothetical protein
MSPSAWYENITLHSAQFSVVIYLPPHCEMVNATSQQHRRYCKERGEYFYDASRFDHGSMIGSITTTTPGAPHTDEHVLLGNDLWRLPHNAHWPESGVGLAAEFGVGDNGATCNFRCGWPNLDHDITNGLLGYEDAENNENENNSFLKIGVGELYKGTCPACDSTNEYKFNSPYMFVQPPLWQVQIAQRDEPEKKGEVFRMKHQATLRNYGYKLEKEIYIHNQALLITHTLTNLGTSDPFSTVWYSHNFFTCDHLSVGPGYAVDLNLNGDAIEQEFHQPLYEEPGTWNWATPLERYAQVQSYPQSVHVELQRALEPGVRIKAEFQNDHATTGGFTITACQSQLESSLSWPEEYNAADDEKQPTIQMYAYNLYVERGTLSPEPQLLLHNLHPGRSLTWTQTVRIRTLPEVVDPIVSMDAITTAWLSAGWKWKTTLFPSGTIAMVVLATSMSLLFLLLLVARRTTNQRCSSRRRLQYEDIA